ncbi:5181_t:CDS:2 [Funneliformis caledonium]|uniref:5181_t:CDS:1 n=1 Tax=Funneliformis caledonium TaxID=1117310 RepID=A0A9N9DGS2_9GLOM|nr:5181_t:CDS:2 [Funneliformis caledonium]
MSLLQYGFELKRVRSDSLQNDQASDNENNPSKDAKKSYKRNNKIFKPKWLNEFFGYAMMKLTKEYYNDAEKLESSRIQMESLQKEFTSSNANMNHIVDIMRAVYFLAKKNLPLRLLSSVIELLKESGSLDLFSGTITYTNNISGHEFLEAISNTIKEEIWN